MAAPVKHTCPDIDAMQKFLGYALGFINVSDPAELTEQDITNAINEIEKVKDGLEELRISNSQLRGWGEDEEDKNAKLENQVDELQDKITDLEKERTVLENQIEKLEKQLEELENEDPVF